MIKLIAEEIIEAVRDVTGSKNILNLHEPELDARDIASVSDCIKTGFVSSVGEYVTRFEKEISQFTGAPFVVAASTGTSALQVALQVVGVQRDDEVLVPALSFIATANAVTYLGAQPHFVDVCEEDFGIDPQALRRHLREIVQSSPQGSVNRHTGRVLRACVPMHCFGFPAQIDEIKKICDEFKIEVVEDAAEGLGSTEHGQHVGRKGKASALSFNGNKIITTGGGGAILFESEELAKRAKHLTTTAKKPHPWKFEHDEIGYNFRMPNLNAALGVSQLAKLPDLLKRKRNLAKRYALRFANSKNLKFAEPRASSQPNCWLNTVVANFADNAQRDEALGVLHRAGVLARPVWNILAELPIYRAAPRADLATALNLEMRIINLPSSAFLEKP